MLFTAERETGTFIEPIQDIQEGLTYIALYEASDVNEGIYTENFYDIVDENHISVL